MRSSFFLALILSVVLGITYWYQSTAHLCPAPIAYRLGQIDEEFALTPDAAQAYLAQAEAVWSAGTGRQDLFYFDETADFPVNFIFDDRQALANAERLTRAELDTLEANNNAAVAALAAASERFTARESAYETAVREYETRLAAYNAQAARLNAAGGATSEELTALTSEQQELDRTLAALAAERQSLQTLARDLNEQSEEVNERIREYNTLVNAYNADFAAGREFTQGDYQGSEINIYKFSDEVELVSVLAHELGHALGLGHVEGEESVMYYLMTERTTVPTLSEADQAAFLALCGTGDEWDHQIRRMIRESVRTIEALFV
jgi:hypothetical protein